jgi:rubrerythrin
MSLLELMWRCLRCGRLWPNREGEPLPDVCPNCGAPKTEFELIEED